MSNDPNRHANAPVAMLVTVERGAFRWLHAWRRSDPRMRVVVRFHDGEPDGEARARAWAEQALWRAVGS